MDLLRGIGSNVQSGFQSAANAFDAPNPPGQPSVLGLLAQQPEHILRDLIQVPSGLLDYGLARFAEPGAGNTLRNMQSANLLSTMETDPRRRQAMLGSPDVTRLAGVATEPPPPGGITPENAAQFGLDPVSEKPFFPFVRQIPVGGMPAYVDTPEDQLKQAQMENQRAQAAYFNRNAGAGGAPAPGGMVEINRETRNGPRGPETVIHYGPATTQTSGEPATGGGMPALPPRTPGPPPPAALPPPPPPGPAATPPPRGTAPGAPGAPGAQGAAPTGQPAAPRAAAPTGAGKPAPFAQGATVRFTDDTTGETFEGTMGPGGKVTGAGGEVRTWDGKTLSTAPAQKPAAAPAAPGPVEQGPEGTAATPAYASYAPREEAVVTPAPPVPGAAAAPVQAPKEAAIPGGPTPEMKRDFNAARQQDPRINAWLAAHPEYNTLERQIWATAGVVDQWKRDKHAEDIEKISAAKLAGPARVQADALASSIKQMEELIAPMKDGQIPLSVFDRGVTHLNVGQVAGGPDTMLGQFLSPAGQVGIPGLQGWESIPQIAKTEGHPLQQAAIIVQKIASGVLPELARAASISGRLTNRELTLMREAYVPTPGIDTLSSAVGKVQETIKTFKAVREQLLSGRPDPLGAEQTLRARAGVGTGPRILDRTVPEDARTLGGGE